MLRGPILEKNNTYILIEIVSTSLPSVDRVPNTLHVIIRFREKGGIQKRKREEVTFDRTWHKKYECYSSKQVTMRKGWANACL
jgi:hypothetical protein